MVRALQSLGAKNLLVEGGGQVMWEFARKNLIDDYFLTLTPRVLGGKRAPTLVDGVGFLPSQSLNLKLIEAKKVGNELFLKYKKTPKRGP
jgi:riboflavin biosynthesis pyrimidine reductase